MNFNKIIYGMLLCASAIPAYASNTTKTIGGDDLSVVPSATVRINNATTAVVNSNIILSGVIIPEKAYDADTGTFEPDPAKLGENNAVTDVSLKLGMTDQKNLQAVAKMNQATEKEKTSLLQTFDDMAKLPNQPINHVVKAVYPFLHQDVKLQNKDGTVEEIKEGAIPDFVSGEFTDELPSIAVQMQKTYEVSTGVNKPLFQDGTGKQYYLASEAVYLLMAESAVVPDTDFEPTDASTTHAPGDAPVFNAKVNGKDVQVYQDEGTWRLHVAADVGMNPNALEPVMADAKDILNSDANLEPIWQQNPVLGTEENNGQGLPLFQDAKGNVYFLGTAAKYQQLDGTTGAPTGEAVELNAAALAPVMAEQQMTLSTLPEELKSDTIIPNTPLYVYTATIDNLASRVYSDKNDPAEAGAKFYLAAGSQVGARSGDVIDKVMVHKQVEAQYYYQTEGGDVYTSPDQKIAEDSVVTKVGSAPDYVAGTTVLSPVMEQDKNPDGKPLYTIRREKNAAASRAEVCFDEATNTYYEVESTDGTKTDQVYSVNYLTDVVTKVMTGEGTQKNTAEETDHLPIFKVSRYDDNTVVAQDADRYLLTEVKDITATVTASNPTLTALMVEAMGEGQNVAGMSDAILFLRADVSPLNQLEPVFRDKKTLVITAATVQGLPEPGKFKAALFCSHKADAEGNMITPYPTAIDVALGGTDESAKITLDNDTSLYQDGTVTCNVDVDLAKSAAMPQSDIMISDGKTLKANADVVIGPGKSVTVGKDASATFAYTNLTVSNKAKLVL